MSRLGATSCWGLGTGDWGLGTGDYNVLQGTDCMEEKCVSQLMSVMQVTVAVWVGGKLGESRGNESVARHLK